MQWKTVICLFLTMTVIASCASFRSRNDEEARLHHRVGMGQLDSGNLPGAFTALMQAEKLAPEDPLIQNSLGLAYFLREKYDFAEKHFTRAVELKSDYSDAKNNLARTWIERGQYDRAIALLQDVMGDMTYPHPEKPLLNAGIAHFRKSEFRSALEYFKKAVTMDRENCMALNYLGRSIYELKDYVAAASSLDRAVASCQRIQFDEPHYYSALAYFHSGDKARATARLEEVTKLYPSGAYNARAQTLLKEMRK